VPSPSPTFIPFKQATINLRNTSYWPRELAAAINEPLVITLSNQDPISHDFILQGSSRPVHLFLTPGKRIQSSLFFSAPGLYQFYCSLPGHRQSGMQGTIAVS
jgi:plastocyanin